MVTGMGWCSGATNDPETFTLDSQRHTEVASIRLTDEVTAEQTGLGVRDLVQLTPSQRPAVIERENWISQRGGAQARDHFEVSTRRLQKSETAGLTPEKRS